MNNIPVEAQNCGPHAAPTGRLRFVLKELIRTSRVDDPSAPVQKVRVLQQEWEGRHGKAWADVPFEENP